MASKKIEILLIEDNPDDVKLALKAFEKSQLTNCIHIVNDGEEALDFIYSKGKFENHEKFSDLKLILLDLKLPKIDGLEVLKIIKSDPQRKKIPIVVLTSSKEERDILESYKLGVNSYIVKPIDFDQFIKSVTDIGIYWLSLNQLPMD